MTETIETAPAVETNTALLRPLKTVKGSDQLRLLARLKAMGFFTEEKKTKGKSKPEELEIDLDVMADFIDYVAEKFALDQAKFEEFTMGPGGYERALETVVEYASVLGEGNGSAS